MCIFTIEIKEKYGFETESQRDVTLDAKYRDH